MQIATLPIETEADVVTARQWARRIAELIGFERQHQTRIATAVSEVARNAFTYAGGGTTEFFLSEPAAVPALMIQVRDQGPGISSGDLADAGNRAGNGLVGARRLMDIFTIDSQPGRGTTVTLGQRFPAQLPRPAPGKLAEIAAILQPDASTDLLRLLRDQNRELMQSLEELRRRQEESEQLSRELGDTNRGVVALYAELDERAEQLRRASELKSRFLSHMGHEFRTPLNSIMALSRMLLDRLDGDLNTEQERQVGYIRRSAESLLELVNDLLDLAKVEAGKVDIRPLPFTVKDLFGALRGALRPLLNNQEVDLSFEWNDDLPELFTDEAKVAQILRNLISNALKFTERGEVRVSAWADAERGHVIFSVHDTGIGIAPGHLDRIFEEFEQVETRLHRKAKGTGLGLPLSRNLAALLGGSIEVESVVGQGSVFRVRIPARFGAAGRQQAPDANGAKRVLVIDDDEAARYVMRQFLRDAHPRFEPIEAGGGEDGLRLARETMPSVIILDLQMPDMDGLTVLRELQADPQTRAIPVIIATSLSVTSTLRARLPAGIRVIPKDGMTREVIRDVLCEATELVALS